MHGVEELGGFDLQPVTVITRGLGFRDQHFPLHGTASVNLGVLPAESSSNDNY